jgi:hypothetical protein
MERGVYAQGWYARQHNYHPSRPARRLKMLDDFADYRATMLTWPALGGGGISLPYLEDEADGEVPARFRFYGYLTDREFNAACTKRGIKAFSVIFCMQGWEFPAELSEDEDEILALNELRGVGKATWLGLREFTQNTYPKIWTSFESYFPQGLRNSDGEAVTDLWEECCSRDVHGKALRADWLECPDREHICHFMDTNNPVWREYLKAVIRIHIDVGVDGIQFDEPDGPIGALKYGGCFCKDCMKGFTAYLQRLPSEDLPPEVGEGLADFNYARWLLAHGSDRVDFDKPDFLARAYATYLRGQNAANFHELATYAREYATSVRRPVLISANLYDGAPWHDPLVADVDILVPEQRHTLYRQPGWMRYIAGLAADKPVTISFNPYGGILPELLEALNEGRALDRYRTMMYEAAALGANMSVPYGAWMGSVIEDAFYAPHIATKQIQAFLDDNEHLYGHNTNNDTAIVYSMDSNLHDVMFGGAIQSRIDAPTGRRRDDNPASVPFFDAAEALVREHRPFDVLIFHDGLLRPDDATEESLSSYLHVVLPNCRALTSQQVAAVIGYLNAGGKVTVVGDLAGPKGESDVTGIIDHPNTRSAPVPDLSFSDTDTPQVHIDGVADVAINLQRGENGTTAMHLINYDYDEGGDRTKAAKDVEISVRLPHQVSGARVHAPGHDAEEIPFTNSDRTYQFTLPTLDGYAIVELLP